MLVWKFSSLFVTVYMTISINQQIFINNLSHKMSKTEREELLETFKSRYVGRGVWKIQHKLSSKLIKKDYNLSVDREFLLETYHTLFVTYCRVMYCLICRHHAADVMIKNPGSIIVTSPDPAKYHQYFEWLYNFHVKANQNAEKGSPDFQNVYGYYVEGKNTLNPSDLEYDRVQNGYWHYFFLLTTKSSRRGHATAIYYLILEIFDDAEEPVHEVFREFIMKHRFTTALKDSDISETELCSVLFDWIYALYKEMNEFTGNRVFSRDTVRETYYTLEYCMEDCDK